LLGLLGIVALVPAPAQAAKRKPQTEAARLRAEAQRAEKSRNLWATVNLCDTKLHPHAIGVRASMPALGDTAHMSMRIRVEYYSRAQKRFKPISSGADSGIIGLGTGRNDIRESGRIFTFEPPSGSSFVLRGVATFEWRRKHKLVLRTTRTTQRGHPKTMGAEPKVYSAAMCELKPPTAQTPEG
jgi:hypothetical protein